MWTRWASNFAPVAGGVVVDDLRLPTVEHAFQAAKTLSIAERRQIAQQPSPGKAKRMGKKVKLREGWSEIRERVMIDLLRQKFRQATFQERLLATGEAELVEANTWHDIYWGCCTCPQHKGQGQNRLGIMVMQVREELRAEACSAIPDPTRSP